MSHITTFFEHLGCNSYSLFSAKELETFTIRIRWVGPVARERWRRRLCCGSRDKHENRHTFDHLLSLHHPEFFFKKKRLPQEPSVSVQWRKRQAAEYDVLQSKRFHMRAMCPILKDVGIHLIVIYLYVRLIEHSRMVLETFDVLV